MFATLAVFFSCIGCDVSCLWIETYLAMTLTNKLYHKAIMCALLSPVIVIIMAYQLGIAFNAPLEIYKIAPPLLIISLLVWIPTGVIISIGC